ncbi:Fc.00g089480.m01.CDS01 [Cosmosporella sp. VM-42]
MSETQVPQTETYRGNCHCGAFVYEATIPEIKRVVACACKLCTKKGSLWTAVPDEASFKIVKGDEDALTVYEFGPKTKSHKFCPTCGSAVFGRSPSAPPGKTLILNVRCIQDLDVWSLDVVKVNAGDANLPYEVPEFRGPEPKTDADPSKIYYGSCHCGAVTIAVKTHPMDDKYPGKISECSCSICQRNGYIWIYPRIEEVVIQGKENLTLYAMGKKMMSKTFCKTCGIPVGNVGNKLSGEEIEALGPDLQKWYHQCFLVEPINIRTLNGFDLESVETSRFDGFNLILPKYVNP